MRPVLLALAVLVLVGSTAAASRRNVTLRFPRLAIPAGANVEACAVAVVPARGVLDVERLEVRHAGAGRGFAVRHFLVYSYGGTHAADLPRDVVQSRGCLDLGVPDASERALVAAAAGVRSRALLPPGVALRLPSAPGDRVVLVLDGEWINATPRARRVRTRLVLRRARNPARVAVPFVERSAERALLVPPATVRSTEDATGPDAPAAWRPSGDACVLGVSGRMHKRGRFLGVDLVGADGVVKNPAPGSLNPLVPGRRHLFGATDYTDPGATSLLRPIAVAAGESLRYGCWHDNGVETPQRLGCEEAAGVAPGVPGAPAKPCAAVTAASAQCPASDPAHPGRTFTGACVRANVVAGPTPDDEACALTGFAYDAAGGGCEGAS
jgi:hypothetical protein